MGMDLHPQQAWLKIPSRLNACKEVAISSLYVLFILVGRPVAGTGVG
jgi:hypothetical protein